MVLGVAITASLVFALQLSSPPTPARPPRRCPWNQRPWNSVRVRTACAARPLRGQTRSASACLSLPPCGSGVWQSGP
jgi:hypothetical protein